MKKNIIISVIALITLFGSVGCTDATRANIKAIGQEHRIRMFSGGELVAEWTSTGKVTSLRESDGWQFMDKETGRLVRVGGDVIIEVLD